MTCSYSLIRSRCFWWAWGGLEVETHCPHLSISYPFYGRWMTWWDSANEQNWHRKGKERMRYWRGRMKEPGFSVSAGGSRVLPGLQNIWPFSWPSAAKDSIRTLFLVPQEIDLQNVSEKTLGCTGTQCWPSMAWAQNAGRCQGVDFPKGRCIYRQCL